MSLYELFFGFTAATKAKHPECFTATTIDRHTCHRTTPMQVLSLGMSRTGTATMHAALTILGYDTYHGFHFYSNVLDTDMWREAYESKYFALPGSPVLDHQFFDKLLGHVSAVTDIPAASFGTDLIAAYPDAKVVLVERDIEAWYKSFHDVFITTARSAIIPWIAWLDSAYLSKMWWIGEKGVALGQFGARNADEFAANARSTYRKHYAELRESMKSRPNHLLEFQLRDGWKPLCEFLGKEVPDVPFPQVNETEIMNEKLKVLVVKGVRKDG
ncbi:hypothetical protein LTR17_020503 [Elasticomyces elasticus]|nr:hypothetical protein LTR17_020503 [Elasticomyces elasticus]